jgi:hypothetical protein
LIANGTVISGSAVEHVFFVNNNGGPATVTLPPANVVGKFIRISPTQAPASNLITVNVAAGNKILSCANSCSPGFITTINIARGIGLVSDGVGNWYQAEVQ